MTHECPYKAVADLVSKFYVCMPCLHLSRLDETGKNSELRMCPHCHVQMQSFKQLLEKLEK